MVATDKVHLPLRELLEALPDASVTGSGSLDVQVRAVECDSRRVCEGALFVAIRGGQERDRHEFVPDALSRGAVGIVVEEEMARGTATMVRVDDCRAAAARLAACFYDRPADGLLMVGVTGTNGKTTTSLLIRAVLESALGSCGYLGTLGAQIRGRWQPLANTTPEAPDLHRALRAAADAGSRAVAMEVSSHAMALQRVAGISFDAAVFTNLTRDHLDFHGSEGSYFESKSRLFRQLRTEPCGRAVINLDDARSQELMHIAAGRHLTYGRTSSADVWPLEISPERGCTHMRLSTPAGEVALKTRLTGSFNCSNIVAAVACGIALEVDLEGIAEGIASVEQVPGRFERIDEGQGFDVIVDYAHTPAGIETVLDTARELGQGQLICVFGCGGDRDTGKRPLMGEVAERLADRVYVTSDNPRSESPDEIAADILGGMERPGAVRVLLDRRQAIGDAVGGAEAGDVVVIAGKGDESYQILGDATVDFDDRQVVRECLRQAGGKC